MDLILLHYFESSMSSLSSYASASTIANLQLRRNRYKRENDKQKCLLMIFFQFFLERVYFMCCCGITNTVISFVAHKLHYSYINNQEKYTTRSSKLKSTQQIHEQHHRVPLDFPHTFSFPLKFLLLFVFLIFFKKN